MAEDSKEKGKLRRIAALSLTMLKIGLFTFGGGYAMVALLEREFVSGKKWIDKDEFLDLVAIAESTPGPSAVNCATYIGYKLAGVAGSAVATLAVCLPSFVIIYLISLFFDAFLSLKYVGYAFRGIQVCVIYLICSAGIKMLREMEKDFLSCAIVCVTVAAMTVLSFLSVSFSSVFYILIGGAVGVFAYFLSKIVGNKRKDGKK